MAQELKSCKDKKDLYEVMYGKKYPLLLQKNDQSTMIRIEEAKKTWQQIQEQYGHLLEEQGYVSVGKNKEEDLVIGTGKPGKPRRLNRAKEVRVTVRLDEKTNQDLEDYCSKMKLGKADAIRQAIQLAIREQDENQLLRL